MANTRSSSGYGVLDLVPSWSSVKCRHRYAVSSLMDTAYWYVKISNLHISSFKLQNACLFANFHQTLFDVIIPMQERLDLNKTQGASTPGEMKRMQNVPYALDVEAEYIVASEVEMEAVWIRKFISRLGIVPTINEPIKMFCDNSATLLIANELGVQRGARHYHRRYLLKVHIDDNLADPFTKSLPKGNMGLRLASSFM
ncbi:hypothetical protein Tco_1070925 [Tanacetum coccineum]|uniref:Uncharacterized protein n=1 Tax=Tanacetum coccineum TaxID=301880 RepID=A0ABQ5HMU2_9ASTR